MIHFELICGHIFGQLFILVSSNQSILFFVLQAGPSPPPVWFLWRFGIGGTAKELEDCYDPMIDRKNPTEMDTSPNDVLLFFNIPFHMQDISHQKILNIYERTCKKEPHGFNFKCMPNDCSGKMINMNRLTVAYSRPKNLRDLLCPSKLVETDDVYVAQYIND